MSRPLAPALLLAAAAIAAGPPEPAPRPGGCGGVYVVVRGDTLYSIARRCHSTVVAIAGASRLNDPRRIEIGQRLLIPGPYAPQMTEPGKPEPMGEPGLSYHFRPGDTIYSLARWARVGVGPLLAANPGIDPHKIEIGDLVRLPAGAADPEVARRRERGIGPGPAWHGPLRVLLPIAPVMPPRVEPVRPRLMPPPPPRHPAPLPPPRPRFDESRPPPPPPPRHPKPDDEREPEGM